MLETCFSAEWSATRRSAIARFERPSAIGSRTSNSRGVISASGLSGRCARAARRCSGRSPNPASPAHLQPPRSLGACLRRRLAPHASRLTAQSDLERIQQPAAEPLPREHHRPERLRTIPRRRDTRARRTHHRRPRTRWTGRPIIGHLPTTYQPASPFWPLQLTETGIFVGIAVALILFTAWRTHKRTALPQPA